MNLPEDVLSRWGLEKGGVVALVDLGEAVLVAPGGLEDLRRRLLQPVAEVDDNVSPDPHVEFVAPATALVLPADDDNVSPDPHVEFVAPATALVPPADDDNVSPDPRVESWQWPPDADKRIQFSVAGDVWEVLWGRHDEFGTPAYWIDQTNSGRYADEVEAMDLRTATVWGLLHGHGVRAEVGNAFLKPVIALLEEDSLPTAEAVETVLRTPIAGVGRYRFPNKAAYISGAVARIAAEPPPDSPRMLRDYLLQMRGVGPKTAALIESGLTGLHAEVHINDIWLRRALIPAGVFRSDWDVSQHYDRFEAAFLLYARHGNVLPGALDWCIWELARAAGSGAFASPA